MDRIPDHVSLADSGDHGDLLEVRIERGILEEEEVLCQVVDDEHPAFPGNRQFADLRRSKPVDIEQSDDVVLEAEQTGEEVLVGRVQTLCGLGIHAHDR